jgi:hypothetical protein
MITNRATSAKGFDCCEFSKSIENIKILMITIIAIVIARLKS